MESEENILVVILDTSLTHSIIYNGDMKLTEYLDAAITFINCYLMFKLNNKVAVIVTDSTNCQLIYPHESDSNKERQFYGQCQIFTEVESSLRAKISHFILENTKKELKHSKALIGAACGIALCYIARLLREKDSKCTLNSRILVITGSDGNCDKYLRMMNMIFAARKYNVLVDVCSLKHDIDMLEKACDLTKGIFFKIPQVAGFLQYLLSIFLPDASIRKKLLVPVAKKVDYRPFCYCHREIIDMGYICSVCLSVFCKFTPICTTCEVVFKMPAPLPMKSKKKKIKTTAIS